MATHSGDSVLQDNKNNAILLLVTEQLKKIKSVLSHIAHSARAYLGFSSIFLWFV